MLQQLACRDYTDLKILQRSLSRVSALFITGTRTGVETYFEEFQKSLNCKKLPCYAANDIVEIFD